MIDPRAAFASALTLRPLTLSCSIWNGLLEPALTWSV